MTSPEFPVRSQNPEIRKPFIQHTKGITPDIIANALRSTFRVPQEISGFQYDDTITDFYENSKIEASVPPWIDIVPYEKQFLVMNSPQFWRNVFMTHNTDDVVNLSRTILQEKNVEDRSVNLLAARVADNNNQFFGQTTVGLALSALLGNQVEKALTEKAREMTLEPRPSTQAILAIGEQFGGPALSMQDLFERLVFIFAEREGLPGEGYTQLIQHNGFRNVREDEGEVVQSICPAAVLTEMIYREYGNLLQDPYYLALFKDRFRKKSLIERFT